MRRKQTDDLDAARGIAFGVLLGCVLLWSLVEGIGRLL